MINMSHAHSGACGRVEPAQLCTAFRRCQVSPPARSMPHAYHLTCRDCSSLADLAAGLMNVCECQAACSNFTCQRVDSRSQVITICDVYARPWCHRLVRQQVARETDACRVKRHSTVAVTRHLTMAWHAWRLAASWTTMIPPAVHPKADQVSADLHSQCALLPVSDVRLIQAATNFFVAASLWKGFFSSELL